jgi:hypothetical protein
MMIKAIENTLNIMMKRERKSIIFILIPSLRQSAYCEKSLPFRHGFYEIEDIRPSKSLGAGKSYGRFRATWPYLGESS